MCLFIESIKLLDGKFFRLEYHQKRVDDTFAFHFANKKAHNLESILNQSSIPHTGLYKCRMLYGAENVSVEFAPYTIREIKSLRLIHTDIQPTLFKSAVRKAYDEAFDRRGECDDVLLIHNGLITDSSYCNVAFFDGNVWISPQTPLLKGTNLSQLVNLGLVQQMDILYYEISKYSRISLFNAMIEFGDLELDISQLIRD